MPQSKVVGVRIPSPLLTAIDALVGEGECRNRSEVILDLIQKGLAIAPSSDTTLILERLDAIEGKLPDWNRLTQ